VREYRAVPVDLFVFLTHEAAGASTSGIPTPSNFFQGDRLMHNSGKPCRENAEVCRPAMRLFENLIRTVITRESG
jgi:hypothetical protein